MDKSKKFECVLIENNGDGITWVTLNRPEKRNAMSPQLHFEMEEVMMGLETDADTQVIVLTGAGESWNGGQDLKEFFRNTDGNEEAQFKALTASRHWNWELLSRSRKVTIAMVNGYCFGGAFMPLIACDFVVTDEAATYGLSEVNWGIVPAGLVTKVFLDATSFRETMLYAMTGRTFDGKQAVEMKLANIAVPQDQLRDETVKLANELMAKGPDVLATIKQAVHASLKIDDTWTAYDYLMTKNKALQFSDRDGTRDRGIEEFIDKKSYRPGLEPVKKG